MEHAVRCAGRQNRISTRMLPDVKDIMCEANYWAVMHRASIVTETHVQLAIHERISRVNMEEEKLREMIGDGSILIDTHGEVIGQVNGLSVVELDNHCFGLPTRITATASVGKAGIVNVEREAGMSGHVHNKGVLILSGYMRSKYSQFFPLTLDATICFEQSYSEIDGDSAASSEMYALLSALSNLPIRQDIAVTGSINQRGELQAVGSINEKIEGFFRTCVCKGLTGSQGVLIPFSNLPDLMLDKEVLKAIREGKFHIWAVRTIDEGIELLTGVKAGSFNKDDQYQYEEGTVNFKVHERLYELASILENFGAEEEEHDDDTKEIIHLHEQLD